MPSKKLPFRPNVCMLVYNAKGKLFLGERKNHEAHWQFPQGGAEPEYSLRENVKRELAEELGLKRSAIGRILKLKSTHVYEWHNPPAYARGRWCGQSQTFWLVEFVGKDSDIDLDAIEEPEFSAWKWCAPRTVRRLAVPHRLPGYESPLREFEAFWRKLNQGGYNKVKKESPRRLKRPHTGSSKG
jgi:putative (di)nucleoside polyphosphate hydrolase